VQFWAVRKGFYFTAAGSELPLVWFTLLGIQAVAGDGPGALAPSPNWRTVADRLRLKARVA